MARVVYVQDRFDPLPVSEAYVVNASLIMINVSLLPLRVCVRLHLCQAVTRRLPTPPRSDQGREEEAFI